MADSRIEDAAGSRPALTRPEGTLSHGGSAAIYGFLHQLTASLRHLLDAQFGRLTGKVDPNTITAIFESSAGGDLTIDGPSRKVFQFKHRNVAVSISTIADKVLPDLYRAHCNRAAESYTLHTTNGVSKPGWALIANCRAYVSAKPNSRADFAARPHVQSALSKCQGIFAARRGEKEGFVDDFATFLSRFEIATPLDAERARADVLRWLSTRIAYAEEAEANLDRLIGHLVNKTRHNDARITVDDLLDHLGLPDSREGHPDEAAARLGKLLATTLSQRNFDPGFDVREPIAISPSDPLTIVAGPSGCGKSWTLYRLAATLASGDAAVVLVRAATLDDLKQQLRLAVGSGALLQERPIEPTLLGQVWRRIHEDPNAVITVLWEGCRDIEALDDIRVRGGFGPGCNLVVEFPVSDGERLAEFQRCPVHQVGEFTPVQLFEALEKRGVAAGLIPRSIRRMLRLPILAGIYATLALELQHWNPLSEYRVLEDFWTRARKLAGKLAGTRLKELARQFIRSGQTVASDDEVARLGFSEIQLEALIGAGWLNCLGDRWSFAHDRLLTWAIAEALASDFASGAVDVEALATQVGAFQHQDEASQTGLTNLGFLLMDVVWLISTEPARAADVATFFEYFEPETSTGAETLYGDLVHTAGDRVLPALIERAARITDEADYTEGYLVTAIRGLTLSREQRQTLLDTLWSAEHGAGHSLAISLAMQWAFPSARDQLWEEYCALNADRESDSFDYDLFTRMEGALKTIAQADPAWLAERLAAESGQEELRLAAYLLKSLEAPAGAPVWEAGRAILFETIPEDRQSVLIECVGRFGDRSALPLLVDKIRSGDRSTPHALDILVEMEPGQALTTLESDPSPRSSPYGRSWLDRLLDYDQRRTTSALREWCQKRDSTGGKLAEIWLRAEERIDAATIDFLLDRLGETLAGTSRNGRAPLLALLGSLTLDPVHDPVFSARRGSSLSQQTLARAIGHFDGLHDHHYVAVRRLLRRIGGDEYEALILHALVPDDLDRAHTGITSSIFAPTPAVRARLEYLACHGTTTSNDDKALLDLWRTLLALDPDEWRPKLLQLLDSPVQRNVELGLFLLPEFANVEDQSRIISCVERSEPGSGIEAKALDVASKICEPNPVTTARAIARLAADDTDLGRVGSLNILLHDQSGEARTTLDAYFAPLETAKSWKSTDADALAIRLSQGGASEKLWRAGERMSHRPFMSRDGFMESLAERDPAAAMNVLLERAFAPRNVVSNAQSEAIRVLATLDRPLATQAFIQTWSDQEDRRQYLASIVRYLDDDALHVMIDHLEEDHQRGHANFAYRAACIELRRAHERAQPRLLARFGAVDATIRVQLCEAIGWMPGSPALLEELIEREPDSDVRREADEIRRQWLRAAAAVQQFRALRTLEALEYAIDTVDPQPLCAWGDPLRILDEIRPDSRQVAFAETQLARRFNEAQNSRCKRMPIRERARPYR